MTNTLAPSRRALLRAAALGATLLTAACTGSPTAPAVNAQPSAVRAGTAAKLSPSVQINAGKSGYMLSSGLTSDESDR